MIPPILTADEVMALLCCGRTHLDSLISQGLPGVNIGHDLRAGARGTGRTRRMMRFVWQDVIAWLHEHHRASRP
jgi:predicted DNA-binding transcriptional regulator AlpA